MQENQPCESKMPTAAYEIMMFAQKLQWKMEELSGRTEIILAPIMMPDESNNNQLANKDNDGKSYPPYFADLRGLFLRINERIECIHSYLTRAEME